MAAAAGSVAGCRLLLDRGADVNARSEDGQTPLSQAAAGHMGRTAETVKFLLERGARANVSNCGGETALLGFALPRNFRLGLRFRVGSGNPERPIVGRETVQVTVGPFAYRPIRGPRGTSYQPPFHQLDIRLDKRWVLRRTSVSAYLDVQNVYNHTYPEIWIYSTDWSYRQSALGLPIYPSIGVEVTY